MKKNRCNRPGIPIGLPAKMFLIMKLTLVLTLLLNVSVWATGFAQESRVSLRMENVSLEKVILELRKQTGIRFFYSMDKIKDIDHLHVKAENKMLKEVLDDLLRNTGLTYSLLDDVVVIRDKSASPAVDSLKQTIVRGVVKDTTGNVLPGVTVVIKGTRIGVSTDSKGEFSIVTTEKETSTLVFSCVGMKTKEVKVNLLKNVKLTVLMQEEVASLEEVVITTGYQNVKKRSMAGSTSSVKAEDLVLNGTQTLEQALQGKLPGVMIINKSGLTGTRQKVRVRGTSTLVGNAEPVWVVDGIIQEDPLPFNTTELANIQGTDMDLIRDFVGGAISWLNPNDIDNITVLKDASATAIYGVKAANGVIVITTKKGERGRISLSYSGNFSTSSKLTYKNMELMNSKERVDFSREAYERGAILKQDERVGYMALALAYKRREISYEEFNEGAKKLETNNTDWFDLLFQVPFSHGHSISISGGDDKTTYRASFGYNKQSNTAKGNSREAYTGNLNISSTFWGQVLVNVGLSGSMAKTEAFAGASPYGYASTTNRAIPCYEDDGELSFYDDGSGLYNIINELTNSGNKNTTSSINSNLSVRWTPGHGLTLSSTLGYNYSTSYGESWYTEQTNHIRRIRGYEFGTRRPGDPDFIKSPLPFGGELNTNESRNNNYTWRNQVEFAKTFDRHTLTIMIGEETRSNKYDGSSQINYGYMPDRGKSFADVPLATGPADNRTENGYARTHPTLTDRKSNYLSFYGNMSYMFDERYAVNASIRMDGSNRFGQDKNARFQPVWSVGARWNVTKEHWLGGQNFLNDVSLRASYGYQGNVAENVGPDLIAKIEPVDSKTGEYKLTIARLPTPDLKWEKNQSINLGLDFSILGSHLNGTFEYYYKHTTDMITTREVPYENGVTSMAINGGDMKNSGWDLSFSLVPLRTKDFVWSLSMNTSKVYNKVDSDLKPTEKWSDAVGGNYNKKGYAVSSFWAFRFTGLNPENGAPEFDLSNANTEEAALDVTEYMTYAGKLEPDFTAGLGTSFRYKSLSLSANFYLSTGNKKFLSSPYGGSGYGDATKVASEYQNLSTQLLDRWRKPGDEEHTMIPSMPTPQNNKPMYPFLKYSVPLFPYDAWSYSDIRVVDAWYLRCSNISLSYTMPHELIKRFAQNMNFSFSVSNPFQIVSSDFHGRDPEVASGAQPLSRNYSFSVSVSF